ncbi:unnamed protein product [Effrenium voratum]|uniref:DNA helicase n=1 Tax=Effrenium voratum TaxID=2562239 RepID=A0AA36MRM8_9DINO|nr:unnamed protein product [Effrenium voratum]CAJ1430352.1 unnamed protein product [Effrenium voratum]
MDSTASLVPLADVSQDLLRFFKERLPQLTEHFELDEKAKRREIIVDAMDLFDEVPSAYLLLLQGWPTISGALRETAQQEAAALMGEAAAHLRVRLIHVPGREFARQSVSQLRVADAGRLVRVMGTVTRAGPVKVVQEWRNFKCEQCGHTFGCRASAVCNYEFEVPKECPGGQKQKKWDPKAKRAKTSRCHSKLFAAQPADEACMADFQEIRVQDDMQAMEVGVVPQSCAVAVFGDLVGSCQPGDSVVVEGLAFQRWRPTFPGKRVEVELFLEATHVERLSRDPAAASGPAGREVAEAQDGFRRFWSDQVDEWRGREILVAATAPWLAGLPVPKLALLLTLVGGSVSLAAETATSNAESASRWGRFLGAEKSDSTDKAKPVERTGRTTPHLLLLGDPGTGKSQLLQAAQELHWRSVRTSGLGCTSAGLTCAAVRDGPDWVLEAGALVLADGGVCCIDEFSTIRSHDKAAVHEAMEQQTVSVAKAGLVCRLRSRCSVVAAQNCRGASRSRGQGSAYDLGSSVAVNSGLPPPLLSRFDLVVVFAEGGKGASESEKADFIIGSREPEKEKVTQTPALPDAGAVQWDHSRLRDYVAWAKERRLDEDDEEGAATLLQTYFQKLRQSSLSGGGVTARTLESLVRLAQAHAKLMNHRGVQIEDAVAVVVLHRASLQDHVVGADSLPSGEDFAPNLRDLHEEMAACGVHVSLEGLELNHGSDISSKAIYALMEQAILRSLRLCRASNDRRRLVRLEHQASPLAIADVAFSTAQANVQSYISQCSQAAPLSKRFDDPAGVRGHTGQFDPSQSVAQVATPSRVCEAKTRGRQLGCRLR